MPGDALDTEICHTIRLCWLNTAGLKSLKNLNPDPGLLAAMGQTEEEFIQGGTWGCGDSASRICLLLTGDEMGNYRTAADSVDIADANRVKKAINDMRFATGCIATRINILGGQSGSGHSYVFLGLNRESTSEPLDGHIYQTNIGCEAQFDLLNWINDAKFGTLVNLETHLNSLGAALATTPAVSYEQLYMLTGTSLTQTEVTRKTNNPVEGVRFMWRQVDLNQARARLKQVRKPNLQPARQWPTVATGPKIHLTV